MFQQKSHTINDLNTKHDHAETQDLRELSLRAHKMTSLEIVVMLKNDIFTIFFYEIFLTCYYSERERTK